MKEISVYRVEYEILPSMSSWTAFVVAYSPEEVIEYLESLIGRGKVNLLTIGFNSRVDGITPQVRSFLNSSMGQSGVKSGIDVSHKVDNTIGEAVPVKKGRRSKKTTY